MNRSEAATILLLWQVEGEEALVRASAGDEGQSLVAVVESLAGQQPRRVLRRAPPPPPVDFLELDEEKAVGDVRARLRALAPALTPEERAKIESRVRDLMPASEVRAVRAELERLAGRLGRHTVQRDFDVTFAPPPPPPPASLRSVLLFSKDGRLLAGEGPVEAIDLPALATLVAKGERGSTWSLVHRAGILVGHIGQRAGLVALFAGRPKPGVGGTLRVSLASLEQKDRLASALTHPSSHQALTAYVRAVRSLLTKDA